MKRNLDDEFLENQDDELIDDIFAEDDNFECKRLKFDQVGQSETLTDTDGYFVFRADLMMDKDRYKTISSIGKGVYSTVVKAAETKSGLEVAIKILRDNPVMRRAGVREHAILSKISQKDPEKKFFILGYHGMFEFGRHQCLVFDLMSLNLREVLRKFGKNVGINLKAIQIYTRQLFTALKLLKDLDIVHGDIKPDNILMNEAKTSVRIADFGTGCEAKDAEITPYLASRFYRAPEVILGAKYGCEIDIWSLGCTLYEMFTGKVLFPGHSNNHMIKLFLDTKGKMPVKLIRQGQYSSQHFDLETQAFIFKDTDQLTGILVDRKLYYGNQEKDCLKSALVSGEMTAGERHQVSLFADLVGKCLELQPEKRLTPKEALAHPFCTTNK